MKDTRRRMEIFSTYDFTGIERHLTKMAEHGWILTEIGNFVWTYKRCEPCRQRFAVTYFPAASAFDPEPGEEQQTYINYCEEAGWELCATSAKMQVFRAVCDDAVPIETDGDVQLKTVHRAMKTAYLPGILMLLFFGLAESAMMLNILLRDPIDYFLGMNSLVMTSSMVVLALTELCAYGIWYLRAKKSLANGNSLPKTANTRPLQIFIILLMLAELTLWLFFNGISGSMVTALVSMLLVFGMLGVTFLIRYALKKKKVDAGLSKAVVMTACVLIPVICIPVFGIVTFHVIMNGTFSRAEVVDYHGMMVKVYHDELPLTVEDLTAVPSGAQYSRQLEKKSSLYITRIEGRQRDPIFETQSLPDLEYVVTITKIGWLYDLAVEEALYVDLLDQTVLEYDYKMIRKTADSTVYRMNNRDYWGNRWIFVLDDRVIELNFDESLTDAQLDLVLDRLADVK